MVHIRVVLLTQSLKGVISIKSSFAENQHNANFIFEKIYEIKILCNNKNKIYTVCGTFF